MPRRRSSSWNLADILVWSVVILSILVVSGFAMAIVGLVQLEDLRKALGMSGGSVVANVPRLPVVRLGENLERMGPGHYCVLSAPAPESMQARLVGTSRQGKRLQGHVMLTYATDLTRDKMSKRKRTPSVRTRSRYEEDNPTLDPTNQPVSPPSGNQSCGGPIVEGARWRSSTQTLIIDPSNNAGIPHTLFLNSMIEAVNEWQGRLTTPVFSTIDTTTPSDGFDDNAPDGKNEIMFGFIQEPGVLAMAVIWGFFGGDVNSREIVETDIMFNLHFPWGNSSVDPNVFGLGVVGPHELGHGFGTAHNQVDLATMFPTASEGDTHQRDILKCEAIALCELYGEPGTNCLHDVPPAPAVPSTGAARVLPVVVSVAALVISITHAHTHGV